MPEGIISATPHIRESLPSGSRAVPTIKILRTPWAWVIRPCRLTQSTTGNTSGARTRFIPHIGLNVLTVATSADVRRRSKVNVCSGVRADAATSLKTGRLGD